MNSESTNIHKRRTARILTVVCGLLFSAFSFVYLAFFQKEVLEALHYSLAQGKTVGSKEFDEGMRKAWIDNKVKDLPER